MFSTSVADASLAPRIEAPSATGVPLAARLTACVLDTVTAPFTSWMEPTAGSAALAARAKPRPNAMHAAFFMWFLL